MLEEKGNILVHFYPGMDSGPTQAARYVGGDKLKLPSGEYAKRNKPGIDLFPAESFYFPAMEEIVTKSNWLKGIPTRFKHWWAGTQVFSDNKNLIESYQNFAIDKSKCSL